MSYIATVESQLRKHLNRPGLELVGEFLGSRLNAGPAFGVRDRERKLAEEVELRLGLGTAAERMRSRSHSQGVAWSAALRGVEVAGFGIDFEFQDRGVSGPAARRICSPAEQDLGLTALEAFVIKEACVKARGRDLPGLAVFAWKVTSRCPHGWHVSDGNQHYFAVHSSIAREDGAIWAAVAVTGCVTELQATF